MSTIRLGFLASGGGTSVEALVEKIQNGKLKGFEAIVAVCNRPREEAGVYERAEKLCLPIKHAPTTDEQLEIFKGNVDMILGLGYVRLVGNHLLSHFRNRAWNIHPALLPKYGGTGMYGLAPHQAVLNSGDLETGATIHLMNSEYDDGKIISQVKVPIFGGETPEALQKRVLPFEYALMATTLELYRDNLLPDCKRYA